MFHPIPDNDAKCRISEGCFFALGSYARYRLEKVNQENDAGIDYHLIRQIQRGNKIRSLSTALDFQLKSTENWEETDKYIKYALDSKNYNDIIYRNKENDVRLILILMCLHRKENQWINIHKNKIIFREKLYWFYTESIDLLENENSNKTIYIPKENVLDVRAFKKIVNDYATVSVR
jgi:hypothetical protein